MKPVFGSLTAAFLALSPIESYGQDYDLLVVPGEVLWPVERWSKAGVEQRWLAQRTGGRAVARVTVTRHKPYCGKKAVEPCDPGTWSQKVDIRPVQAKGAKPAPPYYLLTGPVDPAAAGRADMTGKLDISKRESAISVSTGGKAYVIARKRSRDDKRVTVTVQAGSVSQEVYACETGGKAYPFCGDEGFEEILWAGDLDGDGRLDFIAQFTKKYSIRHYYLYVSKGAGNGAHVRLAAKYFRYGE